jgi:hypothetical protein
LCTAQADLTLTGCGPDEAASLKALGKQAGPLAIPPDHLDLIASATTEQKQMT